jgi:hypothetical protein
MVSSAAARGKIRHRLAGSDAGKPCGRWELQVCDKIENSLSHETSFQLYKATFASLA